MRLPPSAAISSFEQALALDPGSVGAQSLLAINLAGLTNYTLAGMIVAPQAAEIARRTGEPDAKANHSESLE
jgi:cytochrome c-type biogenesis protein CcmH/NrfG